MQKSERKKDEKNAMPGKTSFVQDVSEVESKGVAE
jgi:hypothetical protein